MLPGGAWVPLFIIIWTFLNSDIYRSSAQALAWCLHVHCDKKVDSPRRVPSHRVAQASTWMTKDYQTCFTRFISIYSQGKRKKARWVSSPACITYIFLNFDKDIHVRKPCLITVKIIGLFRALGGKLVHTWLVFSISVTWPDYTNIFLLTNLQKYQLICSMTWML